MLNIALFFTSDIFTDALVNFFGFLCYILTECGIYFSTALSVRFLLKMIVSLYQSFKTKILLNENMSFSVVFGHGFRSTFTDPVTKAVDTDDDDHDDLDDDHKKPTDKPIYKKFTPLSKNTITPLDIKLLISHQTTETPPN